MLKKIFHCLSTIIIFAILSAVIIAPVVAIVALLNKLIGFLTGSWMNNFILISLLLSHPALFYYALFLSRGLLKIEKVKPHINVVVMQTFFVLTPILALIAEQYGIVTLPEVNILLYTLIPIAAINVITLFILDYLNHPPDSVMPKYYAGE